MRFRGARIYKDLTRMAHLATYNYMTPPLAYKYVATAVMLMEINYCASRLQLPLNLPLRQQDIRKLFVPHPRVIGFSGTFDFEEYAFSFAKSSKLLYIVNLSHPWYRFPGGSVNMNDYLDGLTQVPSLVDTNGAYRMATNWLAELEVDVPKLEREHRPTITQYKWMDTSPIPLFEVTWDNGGKRLANGELSSSPSISVLISGDTGELIHLRQDDGAYSKRPAALVKDMKRLLAIPDEEFLKYTPEQRSNLVAEFAAVQYAFVPNDHANSTVSSGRTSSKPSTASSKPNPP